MKGRVIRSGEPKIYQPVDLFIAEPVLPGKNLDSAKPVSAERSPLADSKAAEDMLAQAKQEAEAIHKQARELGYREGLESARKEFRASLDFLETLKGQLERLPSPSASGAEEDLARLAVKIAEKILHREILLRPETVTDIVRESLAVLPEKRNVIVLVNKADYLRVQAMQQHLAANSPGMETLGLQISTDIEQGGCRIISETGSVNANPSRQLELLEDALFSEESDAAR